MEIDNFPGKIIRLYQIIQNKIDKKRISFIEEGYLDHARINYEYINLDFIFDELIEVIPSIINLYREMQFRNIRKEMCCVFIAALCEISKRGFSQGGILKQIDEYIGFEFNRNKYYPLIKEALKCENIKIFSEAGHSYEATIVYESGIPKKLHKDLYQLFKIYWKWMRGIDSEERRDFLRAFIEKREICEEYIFDKSDYQSMHNLRDSMIDFQEKVIKTCIRIDKIYTEIDRLQEDVNEGNINKICGRISEHLGYNILTVLNEEVIKRDLIDYAHCVSFSRFQKIIANLTSEEKIMIPTGQFVYSAKYSILDFMCGYHKVRQITYEVIFPYGLKCRDYYELPREMVIERKDHYIYVSECPFQVEIDGYPVNTRELVWNDEILYVFAGKIPPASSAYINGEIIHGSEDIKLQASVRKSWDRIEKKNKLILCIDEVKIFNPKYAMQAVEISCNVSENKIIRQINQRGHLRITEKWIEFEKLEDMIQVDASINGEIVATKEVELSSLYIYSLQTGNRIYNRLEWENWHSDTRIIIFSKQRIDDANVELAFQDMFFDRYVYLGNIDFKYDFISMDDITIEIVKSDIPMIKLRSEVIDYDSCLCIPPSVPIRFSAINCSDDNLFLKIVHGEERFKGKAMSELDNLESISLADCGLNPSNCYGRWFVALYRGQEKICEVAFFVLAEVSVQLNKDIYSEGSEVIAKLIASDECFVVDGEMTNICDKSIGSAILDINGNHVGSKYIEFEVRDPNCDVQYKLNAKPEVWGIRVQDNDTWKDFDWKKLRLDLSTDTNLSLVICSTRSQKTFIRSQEEEMSRYISSGFNHISWKYLKKKWQRINDFVICNYWGEKVKFQILFEPHIWFKELYHSANLLELIFSYYGPVEIRINLVAFANDVKIAKISRQADCSRFDIKLALYNISNYTGQNLVVQVRFDDEDSDEIYSQCIVQKLVNAEDTEQGDHSTNVVPKNIVLYDYLHTMNILSIESQKRVESLRTLDILRCLRREEQ